MQKFSMSMLSFFQCFKYKKPYFGGLYECGDGEERNQEEYKGEDLVCGKCSAELIGGGIKSCKKHG